MSRIGIEGWAGWGEESPFGTGVVPTHFLPIEPGDDQVTAEHERILIETIGERGIDVAEVLKGPQRVPPGTYGHKLKFGGGWPMWLSHLLRRVATTTGVGPYTHAFDVGLTSSSLAGKGMSLQLFKDGLLASSDKDWRYFGLRPTSVEFSGENGQNVRVEWGFMGKGLEFVTHASESYPTDNYAKGPSDAASPTAAFQFGADASEVAYTIRNWSVKIEQPHAEIRDYHDPQMLEPLPSGLIMVTWRAEVLFPGTGAGSDGDVFTSAYRNKTVRSALFTLEGPTPANESLVFDFPYSIITTPPDPAIGDPGPIYQTIEGRAFRSGANNEGTITLINSDSSAY